MTQIKSSMASNHIYERFYHKTDVINEIAFDNGKLLMSKSELMRMVDEFRDIAITATNLAEKEAEERHAKELQGLKDKAIEAFCKGMCDERECRANHGKCTRFKDFTQKLNEKP